ncbi:MAG: 5'/3'-nucleotidase SurE [Pseudomonadota bacterium]
MRILISNDDGVHADGLEVLERIAHALTGDVWVVAPKEDQSGAARALTLSQPLRVREHGDKKFSVQGTPTDCVQMGLVQLVEGKKPDLVLSGVNRGQNIAESVTFSGTVAAALQGMTLGVPSIALSQAIFRREGPRWETAEHHAPGLIKDLVGHGWPEDVVINVNFPDVAPDAVEGVEVTRQGRRDTFNLYAEERTDLRGRPYYWMGFRGARSNPEKGTDLHAVYNGRISVTPLHLSLTHEEAFGALGEALHTAPPPKS